MKSHENFLLDEYVSPKVIAGPHASAASAAAAAALRSDPDYRDLMGRLKKVGFFDASPWSFTWRILAFAAAYLGAFGYMLGRPGLVGHVIACCVVGFAHVQGNFVAHDAGHGAITKNKRAAGAIGQFFNSFLGGYSFSYFCRSHDLHHYHCNEIDRDPNTAAALFSLHEQALEGKSPLTRATTRIQSIAIPLLYPLWSFALRAEGIAYVLRNLRTARVDAILVLGHLALWLVLPVAWLGWWGAILNYLAITAVTGIYIGVIIPVNHVGMPTLPPDDAASNPFIVQQVTTSRNLTSSPVRDFLFIGQNSQIEHHLFPWAPTCNLGRGRKIVREFCRERGIHYRECTYVRALQEVHRHLSRMARGVPSGNPSPHPVLEL